MSIIMNTQTRIQDPNLYLRSHNLESKHPSSLILLKHRHLSRYRKGCHKEQTFSKLIQSNKHNFLIFLLENQYKKIYNFVIILSKIFQKGFFWNIQNKYQPKRRKIINIKYSGILVKRKDLTSFIIFYFVN